MRRLTLLALACLLLAACSSRVENQGTASVTVFEGARLITGDGSAPIENSAFIVTHNQFTQVGRRGELQVPAGATRRLPARTSPQTTVPRGRNPPPSGR